MALISLMYCISWCYRNREHYAVSQRQEENIQLSVPGPVYEEVTPIQEGIKLKLNEEYRHAIINSM